jgi:hypothetical protein
MNADQEELTAELMVTLQSKSAAYSRQQIGSALYPFLSASIGVHTRSIPLHHPGSATPELERVLLRFCHELQFWARFAGGRSMKPQERPRLPSERRRPRCMAEEDLG